jgi:uncharacterized protein YdhG (YjbR/CyaY superfamily)
MTVKAQIKEYISGQPEAKQKDMNELHSMVQKLIPKARLWFLDGKDEKGRQVTNPNVGYGSYTIKYKDGSTREFYQVGFTGNTGGISFYIMGLEDKSHLVKAYGKKIGKAKVTGYCIQFKALKDINIDVLREAIQHRIRA